MLRLEAETGFGSYSEAVELPMANNSAETCEVTFFGRTECWKHLRSDDLKLQYLRPDPAEFTQLLGSKMSRAMNTIIASSGRRFSTKHTTSVEQPILFCVWQIG